MSKHEVLDAEVETMTPVGAVAERVVQKAGQSLAARQEQNNLPAPATPMELLDRARIAQRIAASILSYDEAQK